MLIDSHCHITYPGLLEQVDDVVHRARAAGVSRILTISTTLDAFDRDILPVAQYYEDTYCSVGVHPHHVGEGEPASIAGIRDRLSDERVIAVGESGLDYHYNRVDRAEELRSFEIHCQVAQETGLPLVVHSRDAEADTAAVLARHGGGNGLTGVMHCFTGSQWLADQALEMGFYISFSGIVTFRNARNLREVAKQVPLDRLLIETDSPFLAPQPVRGQRNEPANVVHVAECLAEARGLAIEDLAEATSDNFYRLFQKAASAEGRQIDADGSGAHAG